MGSQAGPARGRANQRNVGILEEYGTGPLMTIPSELVVSYL
jgi:hypothetical protein